MAKKAKKTEVKETERKQLADGTVIVFYEDGSIQIIPAPIKLTAAEASEIFGSEEEDKEDDEDEEDDEEEEDDEDDEDEEDDEDDEEEEEEEGEEEEELTPESLAEMDFEELEDVCEDKDLDTDPDDFDEEDIEKLRKAIAKELGIKLPAGKKEKAAKSKKGKK